MSIVERSEKELDYDDSTVTNKWRWDWLEKKVTFNPLEKLRKLQSWNGGDVTMNVINHIGKLTTSGLASVSAAIVTSLTQNEVSVPYSITCKPTNILWPSTH